MIVLVLTDVDGQMDRRVSWFGQQLRKPHCFRRTLTLSSAEIVFSSRVLVTLLQCCVLLCSGLALFAVCFFFNLDSYG